MKNPFKRLGKPYGKRSRNGELPEYNTIQLMAASELPSSGGALIDVITLQNSLLTLIPTSSVWSQLQLISLANFIESIVLYEKLYVDKESFEHSVVDRFSDRYRLSDILGDEVLSIIVRLSSSESERQFANMYARSVASSVDSNSLYSQVNKLYPNMNIEESMSAGYLNAEFDEEYMTGISLGDELGDKFTFHGGRLSPALRGSAPHKVGQL